MIKVSKLTDDFYPHFLLGFDKFAIKEINQDITFPRVRVIVSTRRRDSRVAKSRLFSRADSVMADLSTGRA